MNRGICVALALVLSAPLVAGAQQAGEAKSPPPAKARAKSAPSKPAAKGAPAAAPAKKPAATKGGAAKPAANAAARALARRTKGIFIFAVESCEREQNRCDPALRDDAELRFMDACGACTSFDRCEQERDAIRAGKARGSVDPCAP